LITRTHDCDATIQLNLYAGPRLDITSSALGFRILQPCANLMWPNCSQESSRPVSGSEFCNLARM